MLMLPTEPNPPHQNLTRSNGTAFTSLSTLRKWTIMYVISFIGFCYTTPHSSTVGELHLTGDVILEPSVSPLHLDLQFTKLTTLLASRPLPHTPTSAHPHGFRHVLQLQRNALPRRIRRLHVDVGPTSGPRRLHVPLPCSSLPPGHSRPLTGAHRRPILPHPSNPGRRAARKGSSGARAGAEERQRRVGWL